MKSLRIALVTACLALAQETNPPLRVSVTLVEVDAVVTGRDGRPVTGLTKDDFEVCEDGKPRPIRNLTYVRTGTAAVETAGTRTGPPVSRLQREQVHRTIALVADDLKMSFASVNHTREALHKFVNEQMAPGDLVAVISTSGGVGALQQFTADKRMLHAAIDRIRFSLAGGQGSGVAALTGDESETGEGFGRILQRRFIVGTLGTVRHVVDGMREMPGRKSVVLFCDGFAIHQKGDKQPPVTVDDVRKVSDRANRSVVVIYTVDPRGLMEHGLQAQDDVHGMEQQEIQEAVDSRSMRFRDNQQSLFYLAAETGGLAHLDNNDLSGGLRRILDDQSGYYLLGFQPGEEDAARMKREGKYHRLNVRVTRPGLRVRYRRGYTSEADEPAANPQSKGERLLAALNSPFSNNGVRIRMTPTFALGDKGELAIRAVLHIDGNDITFGAPDAEGRLAAKLHLVAIAEGDDAASGSTMEQSYDVRLKSDGAGQLKAEGLAYALQAVVKKPGPYHLRIAVMDGESGRIGSSTRFIEVPDIRKAHLALSGVSMSAGDWRRGAQTVTQGREAELSTALRQFRRDLPFSYGVTVYNARMNGATHQPEVALQPRLIRDDRVVWEGKRFPVVFERGGDAWRIPAGGVLTLGMNTLPGEYVLEVVATEEGGKRTVVSQWVDFELK